MLEVNNINDTANQSEESEKIFECELFRWRRCRQEVIAQLCGSLLGSIISNTLWATAPLCSSIFFGSLLVNLTVMDQSKVAKYLPHIVERRAALA